MNSMGLRQEGGRLLVLDQRALPTKEEWVECRTPAEMAELIRVLAIRGAPLIGVAAAMALARFAEAGASRTEVEREGARLRAARPTAVNLAWAVDRVLAASDPAGEARKIFEEDVRLCDSMANHGAALIADGSSVLTHCNSGGLATAGVGTALGAIRRAHEQGKKIHVYVDETRPLLQGARLTAWELGKVGIPYTLICDSMSAILMAAGKIGRVMVGSDRIAVNGDFANKVGTYSLAVLARHHGIPLNPVAPYTTVDPSCRSGAEIPIEERDAGEVRSTWSPAGAKVFNPAFDVTPVELVDSLVLDCGTFSREALKQGALTRLSRRA